MTERDELSLKLFLAKQLPEEISVGYNETQPYFIWCDPKDFEAMWGTVTPREFDYIVRRVEEKLTEKDKCVYRGLLCEQRDSDPFTAPWQIRAVALMKVMKSPLYK